MILSWNEVKTKCPNQIDRVGQTQTLFSAINKTTGVEITQNKSNELIKLKYVLDLLIVYLVNEWKIGNKYVIRDIISSI